jgi:hypothetical protein
MFSKQNSILTPRVVHDGGVDYEVGRLQSSATWLCQLLEVAFTSSTVSIKSQGYAEYNYRRSQKLRHAVTNMYDFG